MSGQENSEHTVPVATLVRPAVPMVGGTAYPPLPIDPSEELGPFLQTPAPRPSQPRPAPAGPAYPSLPVEPDTRDGKPGESK
jgi:hypothetical protein